MISGLALVPSKPSQEAVDPYRKRYDKQYSRIKPHVTVKTSFEIEDGDLDPVIERVRARTNGIPAVEVHATKALSFKSTNNVIYFKVAKTDDLEELFNRSNGKNFYGEAEYVFVLHLTIAQGLSSQEFEDTFDQVALAGVDHRETIDELTPLRSDDDEDKRKVVEAFRSA